MDTSSGTSGFNPKQTIARTAAASALVVFLAAPLTTIPQLANADSLGGIQSASAIIDGTEDKQEIVYGKLSSTGTVEGLYVVNLFDSLNSFEGARGADESSSQEMFVRDYGTYTSVTNLSDDQQLVQSGDSVCFSADGKTFSYQGNLASTDLPWIVTVQYCLDGTPIAPQDLAGKSGLLTLKLSLAQNAGVESSYFDNYLVQATVSLPRDKATNVETEDGSVAVSGSNTQVAFMSLPGKETTSTLSAQVTNFEMEGISIAAVPFSMDISFSEDGLTSGFDELIAGTKELNEGAVAIKEGSSALEVGAARLAQGSSQLESQGEALFQGVTTYLSSAQQISNGVAALAGQSQTLISGAEQTQNALNTFVGSLTAEQLNMLSDEQKQLLYGAQAGLNGTSGSTTAPASAGLVNGLKAYTNAVTGTGTSTNPSLASSLTALTSANDTLLSSSYSYQQGLQSLNNGLQELAGSAADFQLGAERFTKGTEELYVTTQGIPEKVQKEIDNALAAFDTSSFTPHSFVSEKNAQVSLVQFVMTTDGISIPEEKTEEGEEPQETILDRFIGLFA